MKTNLTSFYGIDAPYVIATLFCAGVAVFFGGYVAYHLLCSAHSSVAFYVVCSASLTAVILWAEVVLMFYSSLVGKIQVIQSLVDKLAITGAERFLDVGCGRGIFLVTLARRLTTGHAYGLDLWSQVDQLGNALDATFSCVRDAQLIDKVTLTTGDMTSMPFENSFFDLVVSSLALHNVSEKEGREKALQEVLRVLKPGGRFAVLDFQHVQEYATFLKKQGCQDVHISSRSYKMFPPVRVVMGQKVKI